MTSQLQNDLFRSFGTHAVKAIEISESRVALVIAPWTELDNEVQIEFQDVTLSYVEAQWDSSDSTLDMNLPWDIFRLDSSPISPLKWQFGICCSEMIIGFEAEWPKYVFRQST
ncbi:hypothetical protein [uncultured Vibrio sp.]|uniref:hypothetical protein n=1 Tax=uncultured Vibrio sp. TaxID=114054 RepID=UPI0025F60F5B|nr:hypothetical protein [uncultured Vibrio sp.]